jgi:Family of unknown function (DUF6459)
VSALPHAAPRWDGPVPEPARQPLRVLPIPDTDPPPELPEPARPRTMTARRRAPEVTRYVQEPLAVTFHSPARDVDFGPQPTSSCDLPEPTDWARRIIRALLEAMDGSRPAVQLTRWLAPDVHERVDRRGTLARQRREPHRHAPAVRALLTCQPADGVAEVSAVVVHRGRVRALALRLAGVDGRWQVTALEVG